MRYGFIIDNRKCIGCHACTTACKAEHQVPIGVNRTWVKYTEKGTFPNSRRVFSVMRCNHCTDAPCVEICPVEALFIRDDGIVDFDNRRCIGCKSCMQACPYDALYIDPETNTAAKCNYCAHRIDIGLEPACVNVCPEHAIISGDMDDPNSEISILLGREQVVARKVSKDTKPNLFYIDGDEAALDPLEAPRETDYMWSEQATGVGHYAKAAEALAWSNDNVVAAVLEASGLDEAEDAPKKSIDVLLGAHGPEKARRAYDAPDKGILWGWEVSGYVLTKAIAAGAFLIAFLGWLTGKSTALAAENQWWTLGLSLGFLGATGLLLIKDLDRPDRFLYVLLRPQWRSWLVKGGYSITLYGGLLTLWGLSLYFGWEQLMQPLMWVTAIMAVIVAIYTAFLFAQAKGRDFWQSPSLALHMLVHSVMAGAAALAIVGLLLGDGSEWMAFLRNVLFAAIGLNLFTIATELMTTHPTKEAHFTVTMITKGRYGNRFWWGAIVFGNIVPLALLIWGGTNASIMAVAGLIVLIGIYLTETIWVEAPQRVPLS